MKYLESFFGNMVNSEGRISRSDFWFTILYVFIFNVVMSLVLGAVAHFVGKVIKLPTLYAFVLAFINVIVLLSTVSMQIRRLHDTNRSAWFIFVNLIPIVGQFVVIYFYCLPGDNETNRYGHSVPLSL